MQNFVPASRRHSGRLALFLTAVLAVLGFAAPAGAAPVTITDPSGASISLSDDQFVAGQTITVTGAGFFGGPGSGSPVVFVKVDDRDLPSLVFGGPSANRDFASTEASPAFETGKGAGVGPGEFEGTITLPNDLALKGPATDGRHWLRVLSGAPFTTTGTSLTVPISAVVPFSVVDPVTTGFTNTAGTFFPGTTIPTGGATLTAKGVGFDAGETVTWSLDGGAETNVVGGVVTAEGTFSGTFPAPGASAGEHTVEFKTTNRTYAVKLRYVATSATLLTPTLRAGGTGVVRVEGFVGIGGKGQRVAIASGTPADTKIHGCATADANGIAFIPFTAPADAAAGALTFFALAGRLEAGTCPAAPPTPVLVVDPIGRGPVMLPATIDAAAPVAGTTFTHSSLGTPFPVTGSGFGASEAVQVKLDGANLGDPLTATAAGALTGNVTLPAGTTLGAHVLTFVSATKTAADTITATAAPTYKVTTAPEAIKAGATLAFEVTGFRRGFAREDGATGQKVGIRLDDGREMLACVQADNDGNGTGSIVLPDTIAAGDHTLRFLAGSSCVSGQSNDAPSRTATVAFKVNELPKQADPQPVTPIAGQTPPATTPQPTVIDVQQATKVGKVERNAFTLTLDAGETTKLKVSVKTKSKQRIAAKSKKAKIVTIVKSTTVRPVAGKTKTVTLKLTADGRALLKRLKKVTVIVTVDPDGSGTNTTAQFTLRAR